MAISRQEQIDTLIDVLNTINVKLVPAMIIQKMVDMDPSKRETIRTLLVISKQTIDFLEERTTDDMVNTYYGNSRDITICDKCGEVYVVTEGECTGVHY